MNNIFNTHYSIHQHYFIQVKEKSKNTKTMEIGPSALEL